MFTRKSDIIQIDLLKQMVSELKEQAKIASIHVESLAKVNDSLIHQTSSMQLQLDALKRIHWNTSQLRTLNEVLVRTATKDLMDNVSSYLKKKQLSQIETINSIRAKKQNLSRFGDGEFRLLFTPQYNIGFQKNSPELRFALRETISVAKANPDLLQIAMVPSYRDSFWSGMYSEFWPEIKELMGDLKYVGDSTVSRPNFFAAHGAEAVAAWRSVWDDLSVTVVTGEGGRFDLTPDLFDNVGSLNFSYSLAKDAFTDVPRLVSELSNNDSDLTLLSLGPAGTVLACELAKIGKWSIDIGHISSSYAQIYKGAAAPESMPLAK